MADQPEQVPADPLAPAREVAEQGGQEEEQGEDREQEVIGQLGAAPGDLVLAELAPEPDAELPPTEAAARPQRSLGCLHRLIFAPRFVPVLASLSAVTARPHSRLRNLEETHGGPRDSTGADRPAAVGDPPSRLPLLCQRPARRFRPGVRQALP